MAKETINLEIKSDIKETTKDAQGLASEFKLFGVSLNSVKASFVSIGKTAKVMFGSIKAGLISTGIGAFLVAIGSLTQYFRDSEEGASKFKQITSQLGVVVGNVTDIISDLGKAVFNLVTGNFDGFKESLAEVTDGVKNFGETTKKEMGVANQLEKDRLALQKFEREAIIEKAKTEKDIMKLRLQARDFEKFSAEERLGFMREANKLADEQLTKDLHVAKEKLRFQQVENSFSKSTQENLDAEAQLQAQVFQIERSNFSERKRMKSEEQAVVREIAADNKAASDERQKQLDAELAKTQELIDAENERINKLTVDGAALLDKYYESTLTNEQRELNAVYDKYFAVIEGKKALGEDVTELEKAQAAEVEAIQQKSAEKQIELDKAVINAKRKAGMDGLRLVTEIAGEGSAIGKAAAIASATIGGVEAVQNAFTTAQKSPVTALFPAYPFIQAGLAGAFSAVQLAKIQSGGKAESGGSGGGGGGTIAPTNATPAPQMMSGAFQLGGGVEPEPVKAFVVTDELTNSQDQLANIRRRATI
jgi:hypothetical protein